MTSEGGVSRVTLVEDEKSERRHRTIAEKEQLCCGFDEPTLPLDRQILHYSLAPPATLAVRPRDLHGIA
eukprot:scaffold78570_cov57-Attheya_sp.AAC.1